MLVAIYNDYHRTEARVRVPGLPHTLSDSQVRRVRRKLCGMAECTCGGVLDERGGQEVEVVAWYDRRGDLSVTLEAQTTDPMYS